MKKNNENSGVSHSRRDLLKKAAYVPPALVVLGVSIPITGNAASLGAPPGPPGTQRTNPSRKNPRKQAG